MNGDHLLIDLGNSRLKWGLASAGVIRPGEPLPMAAAGLAHQLDRCWGQLPSPVAVHVANVAGEEVGCALENWVARHWNVPVRFARPETRAGRIVNGYLEPARLGVDRWLALLALPDQHGLPACVADCGTAITFDVVDSAGWHCGGLIAPGLRLMQEALIHGTRGVGPVNPAPPPPFPARDTAGCVTVGAHLACAGLLEKALRDATDVLGTVPALILTGGDGAALGSRLAVPHRYDPHLVLRGLLTLAENHA